MSRAERVEADRAGKVLAASAIYAARVLADIPEGSNKGIVVFRAPGPVTTLFPEVVQR